MQIKIELLSDACFANGTGYGSLIDTETCYDDLGIPFIPSRRIKGILKEAALELKDWGHISQEEMDNIFGVGGEGFNTNSNKITIFDGYVKSYKDVREEAITNNYTKEQVLDYFTYIRYQTAMEQGVAKENSLRSIRVVKKGTIFECNVDNLNDETTKLLEKILKFVKHIGMNRTRGLGHIKVSLEKSNDNKENNTNLNLEDNKDYVLKLHLHNELPLIIANGNTNKTMNYINGASILGYFAGRYLKNHDADSRFDELFIKGKLIFSNAYLSDEQGNDYIPNPLSLNKVKDGDTYYNRIHPNDNSQQLSRVSNKFVNFKNNTLIETKKEVIYHHTRPEDKSIGHVEENADGLGTFYQLEAISKNQYFTATIKGKGIDLKEIVSYLDRPMLIGKSKGIQYGKVNIIDTKLTEDNHKEKTSHDYVLTLLAPTVLIDKGLESIDKEVLKGAIKESIKEVEDIDSFLDYTTVSGYNAKWNLPRPVVNAFKEGTTIHIKTDRSLPEYFSIGTNTQEGLGLVKVDDYNELQGKLEFSSLTKAANNGSKTTGILTEYINEKQNKAIINQKIHQSYNSKLVKEPLVGRLILMMKDKDYSQYLKNVNAIKDLSKRNKAIKFNEEIDRILNDLNFDKKYLLYTTRQYLLLAKLQERGKKS